MFVNWIVGGSSSETSEVGGVEMDRLGDAIVSEFQEMFVVEGLFFAVAETRRLFYRLSLLEGSTSAR